MRFFANNLALTILVAAGYLAVPFLQWLAVYPEPVRHTIWWPVGFAVASVYLVGRRALLGVLLGEWAFVSFLTPSSWWLGLLTGSGNGAEAILGAYFLRRWQFDPRFRSRASLQVLLLVALLCPCGMGLFQVPATWNAGWINYQNALDVMARWWSNDALAVVYLVPLILLLRHPHFLQEEIGGRWLRCSALLMPITVFSFLTLDTLGTLWFPSFLTLLISCFLWISWHFGPRTVVLGLFAHAGAMEVFVASQRDVLHGICYAFPHAHLFLAILAASMLFLATAIVERKTLEGRVRQQARWETLEPLAGGLAHDLNNRLTVILGFSALAREMLPAKSPASSYLGEVEVSAQQIARLTQHLLAYSGRGVLLDSRPVDLGDITSSVLSELDKEKMVEFHNQADHVLVRVDQELVRLALSALLLNALEATRANRASISIHLDMVNLSAQDLVHAWPTEGQLGPQVRFRIIDAGCGMTPEVAERMFEPFFTTKGPGRGLGLAAAVGVMRAVQGILQVRTAEGCGSTIDLFFPLHH